jgi:hypothetical protein
MFVDGYLDTSSFKVMPKPIYPFDSAKLIVRDRNSSKRKSEWDPTKFLYYGARRSKVPSRGDPNE